MLPPAASVPNPRLTTPLLSVQPAPETNVNPSGRMSVTSTPTASLGPRFVTDRLYHTSSPAVTGSIRSSFVMTRSASVLTVVSSFAVSLPACGSGVALSTTTPLVSTPSAEASTDTCSSRFVPSDACSRATVKRTCALLAMPPPVADTNVTCAGSVSVTTTLTASLGPAFVTTSVYTTVSCPAVASSGSPLFNTPRSASVCTVVSSTAWSFPPTGSVLVDTAST